MNSYARSYKVRRIQHAICVGMVEMAYYLGAISEHEFDKLMMRLEKVCIDHISE